MRLNSPFATNCVCFCASAKASLTRIATLPGGVRRTLARVAGVAGEKRAARMLGSAGEKLVAELWRLTDRIRTYRFTLLDAMAEGKIDLLLCPAYATPALPHGMSKNFSLASSYAMLFNATQLPAGTVPVTRVRGHETERPSPKDAMERQAAKVDRASAGLPVGVQIVGRAWEEAAVLAAMAAVEAEVSRDAELPRTPVTEL